MELAARKALRQAKTVEAGVVKRPSEISKVLAVLVAAKPLSLTLRSPV
jgi:hypothetical protein